MREREKNGGRGRGGKRRKAGVGGGGMSKKDKKMTVGEKVGKRKIKRNAKKQRNK